MSERQPAVPGPILPETIVSAVPPHAWFGVSAVFHYLGPAFAVLLFPAAGVLGVAWLPSSSGRSRSHSTACAPAAI